MRRMTYQGSRKMSRDFEFELPTKISSRRMIESNLIWNSIHNHLECVMKRIYSDEIESLKS